MKLSNKSILEAKEHYISKDIKGSLENIYNTIPSGQCSGCAKCCMEAVPAFFVEYLNILNYVEQNQLDFEKRILNHYMNELSEVQYCPFLSDDFKCEIYPVRPLTCRLFGFSTREEQDENLDLIKANNLETDAFIFNTYGMHIQHKVLNHTIEFCEKFTPEKVLSIDKRNSIYDKLFMLEMPFLMEEIIPEDAVNLSITSWFVSTMMDTDDAFKKRIERLKESYNMG